MSTGGRRWLVLSPHCDDALLSIGAALSAHVRAGGSATVVTVLAGSPSSTAAAGEWDAASGFSSEGEAAAARRAEDEAACRIIGVRPVHLGGVDEQYEPPSSAAELWDAVRELSEVHDVVLVPGAPLVHADHRRLAEQATEALDARAAVLLYGEEPYLLWSRRPPSDRVLPDGRPISWRRHPATRTDSARKVRAVRRYRSQLTLLAAPVGKGGFEASPIGLLARLYVRARRGEWLGEPRPA